MIVQGKDLREARLKAEVQMGGDERRHRIKAMTVKVERRREDREIKFTAHDDLSGEDRTEERKDYK